MSLWTHIICDDCWWRRNPPSRTPTRFTGKLPFEDAKTCCFCGGPTWSEIYIRHDGAELRCKGKCDS